MTARKRRRYQGVAWWLLVALCAAVALSPVHSPITRGILVFGGFAAWAFGLFLFWRWWACRVLFLLPLLAVVALALIPYKLADIPRLREAYTRALHRYEGTRFLVGGESPLGIDSTGLVRRALIDAAFSEGWRTKDLSLLRTGAALWWYDASAALMRAGYQGRLRPITSASRLNALDEELILPGDLAISADGQHVLAYLGERTWIEADPKRGKVVTVQAPAQVPWFDVPVRLLRWYRL